MKSKKEIFKILKADFYISILIFVICIFLLNTLRGYPEASRTYVAGILFTTIVLSVILLLQNIIKKESNNSQQFKGRALIRPIATFIFCMLYVGFIPIIGYFYATFLYGILLMYFLGVRSIKKLFSINIACILLIYIGFVIILHTSLPK